MPRPIADWRNAAEYPKRGAGLSPNRWAWEFLRRNPSYQAAWQSCQEIVEAIMVDMGNESCQEVVDAIIAGNDAPLVEDDPRFSHYEPERKAGEDHAAWLTRVKHGTMTPIDDWIATEWGLKNCTPPLPSPYATRQYVGFSSSPAARVAYEWRASDEHMPMLDIKKAFIVDFSKPLVGQIEALQNYAKSHQQFLIKQGVVTPPVTRNTRQNEWPIYLRLLDAELDGVTDTEEIAAVLYAGQHTNSRVNDHDSLRRRINDNQQEARKLRDDGYLWIAATTPKRRSNSRSKNGSVT